MLTILEVITLSADYLKKCNIAHPRRQAEELIAEVLSMGRMDLYLDYSRPLSDNELAKMRSWLKRRGAGEPLQYIQGYVDFMQCRIGVNPKVLIPRQETEILCDKIAKVLEASGTGNKGLLDLCCGSGAIGIALKKRFPDLRVYLSDICPEALAQAKANAEANGTEVVLLQGDLFQPLKGQKVDYVVCNPPYIREDEYATLEDEVRAFEPKKALVSGTTGFEFYERLAAELPAHLKPRGRAWFELGMGQGEGVKRLFSAPIWTHSGFEADWSGHDRFFSLEIE